MIRKVKLSDAAAIQRLNAECLGYDFDRKATEAQLKRLLENDQHLILVAEEDGQVIGYAHAASYDCLYFPSLLNLLALAVAQDFQGKGHGRALCKLCVKREKQQATQEFGLIQAFPAPQPMNFIAASAAAKKQTRNDFIGDFREKRSS